MKQPTKRRSVRTLRTTTHPLAGLAALLSALASAPCARAITPDDPGPAAVRFTINSGANVKPISPYIYGKNFASTTVPVTLDRLGGNRWTGYNWETNASNAGRDWYYQNDWHMTGGNSTRPPGYAVQGALQAAASNDRALIVTVPTNGYVAGDAAGPVTRAQALDHSRFKEIVPNKSTKYPGAELSLIPEENDAWVFTDEFVNWVEETRDPSVPVFYNLDNEPGLWGEPLPAGWQPGVPTSVQPSPQGRTHGALHPYAPRYDELRDKTIANASAIKDVNPNALVLGGVGYGWNDFVTLQDAPDRTSYDNEISHPGGDEPSGEMHYYEFLLKQVAAAESAQGRTLMDVLDFHWYPEAQGGGVRITENNNSAAVVAARVQAARSLWDPTYTETSWITQWGTWVGNPGTPGPIRLLPRIKRDIADFKPGTKIAFTEYNYGGSNHISGGIAQADVLGVFGRDEVFAATNWPLASDTRYVDGAFKMYLNYDGVGSQFGDTSVEAATDSIATSAVYASVNANDPSRMVLVAINRTATDQSTALEVMHSQRFDYVEVYRLTSASSNPVRAANLPFDLVNAFLYTMPAYSVSTLVLKTAAEGDFNLDGVIDGADLAVWATNAGMETGATFRQGDNDRDGDVDGADLLSWQRALSVAAANATTASVPEPMSAWLVMMAMAVTWGVCRRYRVGSS
jgi:hypothetical protein